MFSNVSSLINRAFQTTPTTAVTPVAKPAVDNPFAIAPFLSASTDRAATFGKNKPLQGGFFAGYLNGKQNIVGRKLFIEA